MSWIHQLKRSFFRHSLRKRKIPANLWLDLEKKMPLLARFNRAQKVQLRILASQILAEKHIIPAQGMQLTLTIKAIIATQIAVATYGLENSEEDTNLNWLKNWQDIIVYPTPYRTHRNPVVPLEGGLLGVEIDTDVIESGETYAQGPIIINWHDDSPHPLRHHANQVMLHELAHKIDMLNGGNANGFPPLHKNMNAKTWFKAFETAFEHISHAVEKGRRTAINPYAATNAAEFFAVTSEYFFEAPKLLQKTYPEVYQQLSLFYCQDPSHNTPILIHA